MQGDKHIKQSGKQAFAHLCSDIHEEEEKHISYAEKYPNAGRKPLWKCEETDKNLSIKCLNVNTSHTLSQNMLRLHGAWGASSSWWKKNKTISGQFTAIYCTIYISVAVWAERWGVEYSPFTQAKTPTITLSTLYGYLDCTKIESLWDTQRDILEEGEAVLQHNEKVLR